MRDTLQLATLLEPDQVKVLLLQYVVLPAAAHCLAVHPRFETVPHPDLQVGPSPFGVPRYLSRLCLPNRVNFFPSCWVTDPWSHCYYRRRGVLSFRSDSFESPRIAQARALSAAPLGNPANG
jgi:hypothetical protein